MRRRSAQRCALLFTLSLSGTAMAAGSRFHLAWTSPSVERPCISEEDLKDAVSARLGRDPFVPAGQGEIAIEGRELQTTGGRLRARIVQRDRGGRVVGTRELEATSCEELRRSASFVVFLIVDPDAALGGTAATPAHAERGAEEAPPTEDEPSRTEREAPYIEEEGAPREDAPRTGPREAAAGAPAISTRSVHVDLGLLLVASSGLLPRLDVGPALALGVTPSALPIRLEWRATYRFAVEPIERYDFRAVEQQWRACYFRRVVGAAFGTACGGVTWMAILPDALGLAGGDQAPKTVFSPTLAVGPAFEVEGTRLFVDLAWAMPWPRYAFTYGDEGHAVPLHEVSRMVWSLGIGAARSFL